MFIRFDRSSNAESFISKLIRKGPFGDRTLPQLSCFSQMIKSVSIKRVVLDTFRPSWRGAHNWLRGHIWLVVIRTFVASQANHAGFWGWNHQIRLMNHFRISLFFIVHISAVLTNLRNFVANLALSQLHAFWGALLAEIWWRRAQKIF